MLYHQYRCACCNRAVESSKKVCGTCGSHNIRSPSSIWLLCILACLAAAVVFKVVHIYLQDYQEVPVQQSVLEVIRTQ
ncbi:hypothetical protein [Acinetobacter towneri]|uniref:hypothetical protein n=1 Tax=Acinetobacter towneri TaxID=202956 RepID=UPI00398946F6